MRAALEAYAAAQAQLRDVYAVRHWLTRYPDDQFRPAAGGQLPIRAQHGGWYGWGEVLGALRAELVGGEQ